MNDDAITNAYRSLTKPFGGTRAFGKQASIITGVIAATLWIFGPSTSPIPAALLWSMPLMIAMCMSIIADAKFQTSLARSARRIMLTLTTILAAALVLGICAHLQIGLLCAIIICIMQTLSLAAITID